jgi:hypothetical protein
MRYKVDGKNISIPDAYLEKQMKTLGLTRQEAVDLYLADEGIQGNEIVAEMTAKAKAAGVGAKATGERKERKAPERKPDMVKRAIIEGLDTYIQTIDGVENVEVTNIERMIAFEYAGDKFEITLTKKRKPKE